MKLNPRENNKKYINMVLYGVITTAVISTILNRHKKKETIG